jgi:hypothetical protein
LRGTLAGLGYRHLANRGADRALAVERRNLVHLLSQVSERLLHDDRQLVLIDLGKMIFVGFDKSLFYMAMAGQHRDCGVKAVLVVRHFHSSVIGIVWPHLLIISGFITLCEQNSLFYRSSQPANPFLLLVFQIPAFGFYNRQYKGGASEGISLRFAEFDQPFFLSEITLDRK